MLKGAQKRMVVVKTQDSRIFEEAYFVMRTDTPASDTDMVGEANRIIEACCEKRRERVKRMNTAVLVPIFTFVGGSLVGSGITLLVTLIA